MKSIRGIFVIGIINFILVIGVLSVAQIINGNSDNLITPSPTPVTSVTDTPTPKPTPTPTIQVIIRKIIRPRVSLNNTNTTANSINSSSSRNQTQSNNSNAQTTLTPTTAANPTPTQDPLAGKCIIFIDGVRYDMTDFRKIHGGGDIFQCGTDMSQIFHAQHPDSYLALIAKYKI